MQINPHLQTTISTCSHTNSSTRHGRTHLLKYIAVLLVLLVAAVQFALLAQLSTTQQQGTSKSPEARRLEETKVKDCSLSGLLASGSKQRSLRKSTPPQKKPCALLFFGLAKQFRNVTLPSIREHILEVPEHAECDIYAHNYDITGVSEGTHPEENDIEFDPKEIYDLTSNVVMDTKEGFHAARNMRFFAQKLFLPTKRMGWSQNALVNMYKQWHSIERVWDLMEESEEKLGIEYDRVGLFRTDVKYVTPINIFDGDAVVPKFGFNGINDRMFYGLRENAKVWSKIRFPGVTCYRPPHAALGMHSEFYMKHFIFENIPSEVETRDICFYRVRGNGDILDDDCTKDTPKPRFLWQAGLIYQKQSYAQM